MSIPIGSTEGLSIPIGSTEGLSIPIGSTEGLSIAVDTSILKSFGSELSGIFSTAVASLKGIKISVDTAETGGSVGAAKLDQLAETVMSVNDSFLTTSVKFEKEIIRLDSAISAVNSSGNNKANVDVMSVINNVTSQLNSRVDGVVSSLGNLKMTQDIKTEQAISLARMALDSRNLT